MSKQYDAIMKAAAAEVREGNEGLAAVFNEIEKSEPDRAAREREQRRVMDRARAAQQALHAKLDADLAAKRIELERATFGAAVPDENGELPDGQPAPADYLNAVEKVSGLSGKDLVATFERAQRYNDLPTMAAAARRAIETGNTNIVRDYAATDERFAQNAGDYGAFMQRINKRGRKILEGAALTVHEPFKVSRETVETGKRVADASTGARESVFDEHVTWAAAPKPHPLSGDQRSENAMGEAFSRMAGRTLHGGPPVRAFSE